MSEASMSASQKSAAQWIGVAVAVVGMLLTAGKSIAAYGALEQRVGRMEMDRAQDEVELKAIRILVTRICAVTPGCKD